MNSQSPDKSRTSNVFCRICHDEGDLLSPCNCSGSVGLVHLTCLEKWLSTTGSQSCELCQYEFHVDCQTKSLRQVHFHCLFPITLGQKAAIYPIIHILKIPIFTNSHFEYLNFHKIHLSEISFFTKFTFLKSQSSQNSPF